VIRSFHTPGTADLYHGRDTRAARRTCPAALRRTVVRKLEYLDVAVRLADLRAPPGNRLEPLLGEREGQHSIRINDQYRICFRWTELGPEDVEVVDYH
jgi:proteic killer suppression protein